MLTFVYHHLPCAQVRVSGASVNSTIVHGNINAAFIPTSLELTRCNRRRISHVIEVSNPSLLCTTYLETGFAYVITEVQGPRHFKPPPS